MSKACFASNWTGLEHESVLFRDPGNAEQRLIPVLIGDCDRPASIARFAYVDWREPSGDAYDKPVRVCRLGSATDGTAGQPKILLRPCTKLESPLHA
jgi:hypothetical protein